MNWKNPFVWAGLLVCALFGSYVMASGSDGGLNAQVVYVAPNGLSKCTITYVNGSVTKQVSCLNDIKANPYQVPLPSDLFALGNTVTVAFTLSGDNYSESAHHKIIKNSNNSYQCDDAAHASSTFRFCLGDKVCESGHTC